MRVYYIPQNTDTTAGLLVAVHDESQNIQDAEYGTTARSFVVDDVKNLTRIGDAPPEGQWDTRLIKIPAVPITTLRESALKTMFRILTEAGDAITAQYPASEMLSWGTKDAAARAFLAEQQLTNTQNLLLQSELAGRGTNDMKSLCESIVANAESYAKVCGTLSGLRTATTLAIDEAETQSDLDKILVKLGNELKAL